MTVRDLIRNRLSTAEALLRTCRICPRQCGVDRTAGEKGWCGTGAGVEFFDEYVHFGEEPPIRPSHTVYLTGCNLGCIFCQTAEDRQTAPCRQLTPECLTEIIFRGRAQGARNLNLLGGEPFVNLPGLFRILAHVPDLPPLVWNTNLFCAPEALDLVMGVADTILADLKFGNDVCAESAASAPEYWSTVTGGIEHVAAQAPDGLLIRHLMLPGHSDCCTRPVLEWLAGHVPSTVRVSLKSDYVPMSRARQDARLGRFITPEEEREARTFAERLGLNLLPAATVDPRFFPPEFETTAGGDIDDVAADLIVSPDGRVFLRRPTAELVQAVQAAGKPDRTALQERTIP